MLSFICSDAACWDATGSMMQGWAALGAVFAVLYASKKAANTFGSYRRERQEDRRIDAAERILTLSYKIRTTLDAVRSPMAMGYEHHQAEEILNEANWYQLLPQNEKRQAQTGHVILLRIDKYKKEWEEVFSAMPLARALFGEAAEGHLLSLTRQLRSVQVAAQMYRDRMGTNDPKFRQKLERDFWTMGAADPETNEVSFRVDEAVAGLEAIMLPIIRADHGHNGTPAQ